MKLNKRVHKSLRKVVKYLNDRLDEHGREINSGESHVIQTDLNRPLQPHELILRALKAREMSEKMRIRGVETFEESMDFDEDPEFESLTTSYQQIIDEVPKREAEKLGYVDKEQEVPEQPRVAQEPTLGPKSGERSFSQGPDKVLTAEQIKSLKQLNLPLPAGYKLPDE